MTAPRIIPAAEARALLEAATPGPWRLHDERINHGGWHGLAIVYGCEDNPILGERAAHGNASLICAAHDLARTVVELHAEVERAAAAERARIVALLAEMAEATCGDDGRDTVVSLAYRSAIIGVLEVTP